MSTSPEPPRSRRTFGLDDPVRCDKLSRAAHHTYSPEQLRELGYRLGLDRAQIRHRGHEWDVADILAVFEQWNVDLSA
jgi:hypothetical protein